jgi:potassium channel subfamily T protein 1
VQLVRPEHTVNTKFAEYVVCEDEFKYALMANNCLCPGISTLITLLLHKATSSAGGEGPEYGERWQEQYGRLAGNEVHSIVAGGSKIFGDFVGKSFTEASSVLHKR